MESCHGIILPDNPTGSGSAVRRPEERLPLSDLDTNIMSKSD